MPSPEEIQNLRSRLALHRRTLSIYLSQLVQFGSFHPPYLLIGIEESRREISRIKATLRSWGVDIEDMVDDEISDENPNISSEKSTTDLQIHDISLIDQAHQSINNANSSDDKNIFSQLKYRRSILLVLILSMSIVVFFIVYNSKNRVDGEIIYLSKSDVPPSIQYIFPSSSRATKLTDLPPFTNSFTLSPDLGSVAYVGAKVNGQTDIFLFKVGELGVNDVNLTHNPADDEAPSWSPDGRQIAFLSLREGRKSLYVMRADGSDVRRLTETTADTAAPSWSPDSSRIVFISNRDGSREVYIINVDGTGLTRVTYDNVNDFVPSWSPDGARLAYLASFPDGYSLCLINTNGSNYTRLTGGINVVGYINNFRPVWSPDGQKILFVSGEEPSTQLFTIGSSGGGVTLMRGVVGEPASPIWLH